MTRVSQLAAASVRLTRVGKMVFRCGGLQLQVEHQGPAEHAHPEAHHVRQSISDISRQEMAQLPIGSGSNKDELMKKVRPKPLPKQL